MLESAPVARDPASAGAPVVDELIGRIADRSAKIAFLQDMTGALARTDSLGELLDKTAEIAQQHLPYEVCSTHLVDPDTGRITVVLGSGPLFDTVATPPLRLGEGIVGWVVGKDARYIPSSRRIRSELAVPIRARGIVVGVFNLESAHVATFTAYDEQIFSILAAQIGASLERVDLYREAVARARRLEALNRIARAVAGPLTLDRIFEIVADELTRLIPHDRTTLAVHHSAAGEMEIVGVQGDAREAGIGTRFPTNQAVIDAERPVELSVNALAEPIRAKLAALGISNYIAVPIRLENELVAQLNLSWRGNARMPDGGMDFLSALGSQLAVVLKHARLNDKLTKSDNALVKTQDRLIQSAKLAAVGELAAGVAHELNNPLTGILGYTQWVLLEANKSIGAGAGIAVDEVEPLRNRLEKIEREVLRCKDIVQNLLNFSRSQESWGDKGPPMERLPINNVIEATLGVTEHQLELSRVKVERNLGKDLPAVDGNANQLQQVFLNIVINASKSMPGGGTLVVTTRRERDSVLTSFRDDGTGMPDAVRDRIFEPFFTTRKVGEGTGLGLSVSYGLVKAHGGEITVESEEGKGSTFTIRLPAV